MGRTNDKNFRRAVGVAKNQYRKKRFTIFSIVSIALLALCLIRIYVYHQEKIELQNELLAKTEQIKQLEKDSTANEELITKLKNPYFISDLVRQEYSMSYPGEIVFSLPSKDSFIQNSINSVMVAGVDKYADNKAVIDEKKIADAIKKLEEEKKKQEAEKEKERLKREKASGIVEETQTTKKQTTN